MNWPLFWKTIDRFGEKGAPRCVWRGVLGDHLAMCEPLLRARRDLALSIPDPDREGLVLEVFPDGGRFIACSSEIPAHRTPLALERNDVVTLAPNLERVIQAMAGEIGFSPGSFRSRGANGLHELGVLPQPKGQPVPLFLLIPRPWCRAVQIRQAVLEVEECVLMIPSLRAVDGQTRFIATQRGVQLRGLEVTGPRVSLAVARKPRRSVLKTSPVFQPRAGWTWPMLTLNFSTQRFAATIQADEFAATWKEHGVGDDAHEFFTLLGLFARGQRVRSRKGDDAVRQRLTRFRAKMRRLFPMDGDPLQRFSDGWGAAFLVQTNEAGSRRKTA